MTYFAFISYNNRIQTANLSDKHYMIFSMNVLSRSGQVTPYAVAELGRHYSWVHFYQHMYI